jgi:hypothetical protein
MFGITASVRLAAVWGRSLFAGRGWLVFLFEVAAQLAGLKGSS